MTFTFSMRNIKFYLMGNSNELVSVIKQVIIDVLNLEDYTISDIDSEAPLFGEGLGLDSIDALELGIALKEKFKIKLDIEKSEKNHFYSVQTLSDYIYSLQSERGSI